MDAKQLLLLICCCFLVVVVNVTFAMEVVRLPGAPFMIPCPVSERGQGKFCRFASETMICDEGFVCNGASNTCLKEYECEAPGDEEPPPGECNDNVDSTNLAVSPSFSGPQFSGLTDPIIGCKLQRCSYLCERSYQCPTFNDGKTWAICSPENYCELHCFSDNIYAAQGKCNVIGLSVAVMSGPMASCDPEADNCFPGNEQQLEGSCELNIEFNFRPICESPCFFDADCAQYDFMFKATHCIRNYLGPGTANVCARLCEIDQDCEGTPDVDPSVQVGARCIPLHNANNSDTVIKVCTYGCLPGQQIPTPIEVIFPPAETLPPPPPPINPCTEEGTGYMGLSCTSDADCDATRGLICDDSPIFIWRAPLSLGVNRICTRQCGGLLGDTCFESDAFCDFGSTNRCMRDCTNCNDGNDFTIDFCNGAVVNGVPRTTCMFLCEGPTPVPDGPGFTVTPPPPLVTPGEGCQAAGTRSVGFQCEEDSDCLPGLRCIAFFSADLPICSDFCPGANAIGNQVCNEQVQAGTECFPEGLCVVPCDFDQFRTTGCAQPSPIEPGVCIFTTAANGCVFECGIGSDCIDEDMEILEQVGYEACLTSAQCPPGFFCGYSTCTRDCGTPAGTALDIDCPAVTTTTTTTQYELDCSPQSLCERGCANHGDPSCFDHDPLRSANCVLDELVGERICLGVCFPGAVNPPLLPANFDHEVSNCGFYRSGTVGVICETDAECAPGLECVFNPYQGPPLDPAVSESRICTHLCTDDVDCFGITYGYGANLMCTEYETLYQSYRMCVPQCDFNKEAYIRRRCVDGDPMTDDFCGIIDDLRAPVASFMGSPSTCLFECNYTALAMPRPTEQMASCTSSQAGSLGRTCSTSGQCTPPLICMPNFMGGVSVCTMPCVRNSDCPPSNTRVSYCHPGMQMCASSGLLDSNPAVQDLQWGRCDDGNANTDDFLVTDMVFIACVNVCPGDATPVPPPTPPPTTPPPPTTTTTTGPLTTTGTTGFVCDGAPDYSIGFSEDPVGLSACADPFPNYRDPIVIGEVIGGIVWSVDDQLGFNLPVYGPAPADTCARLLRVFSVSDQCTPGSQQVNITRDEACTQDPGSLPVWANARPSFASSWVDLDADPFNQVPPAGAKSTACDGQTNPQGSWRQVPAPVFVWRYELQGWIDSPSDAPTIAVQSVDVTVPGFAQGDDSSNVTVVLGGQQSCPVLQRYLRWGECAAFVFTPVWPPGASFPGIVWPPGANVGASVQVRPETLISPGDYVLQACVDNSCNGSSGSLTTNATVPFSVPSPICTIAEFPRPDGFACRPLVGGPAPCASQCQRPPGICATPCDTTADCPDPVLQVCTGTGGVCVQPCTNATADCPLPIGVSPTVVSVACVSIEDTPFVGGVCLYKCTDDVAEESYLNYAGTVVAITTAILFCMTFCAFLAVLCAVLLFNNNNNNNKHQGAYATEEGSRRGSNSSSSSKKEE